MTVELRVGNRYRIGNKIGSGSFGEIFRGTNIQTGENVAIKLEHVRTRHPQLNYEVRMYRILCYGGGAVGIPKMYYSGVEGDYNALVMDLLGSSMEDMFCYCSRHFSLKTTLMIADQLLSRIEYVHSKGVMHRDIKPDNMVLGLGQKRHHLYLIDFGLSKKYREARYHKHIPYREGRGMVGTARYCSINTHLGIEQSRRDDMESIGYVLIYFIKGSLPWQGISAPNKTEKYAAISRKKQETTVENLCAGLPKEFAEYMTHVRELDFEDKPDYAYLRRMFRDLFDREEYCRDYIFDWTLRRINEDLAGLSI